MKRLCFRSLEIRSYYDERFKAEFQEFCPGLNIILGPNASGKSTLAQAAMGILSPGRIKGKDRICAELLLEDEGSPTLFHADVDRKTKEADWPQSLRSGLYALALEDLISGPGEDDTRIIREAVSGGVDLRTLFSATNKRPPSLANLAQSLDECEQEAARIAGEEARCEEKTARGEELRHLIRRREQLNLLRQARQAEDHAEALAREQEALCLQHPGLERQPEDALDRIEQARERLRRHQEEHQDTLRALQPYGGTPASTPLPAADHNRLQILENELNRLRSAREREETERQTRLRAAQQQLEEARTRLSRWTLSLPRDYSPTDEAAVLQLLDTGNLPGLQDQLREQLARKQALKTEADLRETLPIPPGLTLILPAALLTLSLLAASLHAHRLSRPDTPFLLTLLLGSAGLTLAHIAVRRRRMTQQQTQVQHLRDQAAAIDSSTLEAQLAEQIQAFRVATGLHLDSAYALDLATRRAREVCEARMALLRARETCEQLCLPPKNESESLIQTLEDEISALYTEYGQAHLISPGTCPSETLPVFLAYFERSDMARRGADRVREAENDLIERLNRFGAPPAAPPTARIEILRERLPALKKRQALLADHAHAVSKAETLAGQLSLTPTDLAELGLGTKATPAEIDAAIVPLLGLESEREALEKELREIRTRVGVLEAGGGKNPKELTEQIEAAETFLHRFIERRAGFHVMETLEEAVRRENTPQVIHGLERWLARFTGGRYHQPEVRDGQLVITDRQSKKGECLSRQLSTGTRVHLAVAVRLAVIETTEQQGIRFPLFLDDILAVSDPEARQALLGAVQELQSERQVFLLTSRPEDLGTLQGKLFSL